MCLIKSLLQCDLSKIYHPLLVIGAVIIYWFKYRDGRKTPAPKEVCDQVWVPEVKQPGWVIQNQLVHALSVTGKRIKNLKKSNTQLKEKVRELEKRLREANREYNIKNEECEQHQEAHSVIKCEYEEMKERLMRENEILKTSLCNVEENHEKALETIRELESERKWSSVNEWCTRCANQKTENIQQAENQEELLKECEGMHEEEESRYAKVSKIPETGKRNLWVLDGENCVKVQGPSEKAEETPVKLEAKPSKTGKRKLWVLDGENCVKVQDPSEKAEETPVKREAKPSKTGKRKLWVLDGVKWVKNQDQSVKPKETPVKREAKPSETGKRKLWKY